MAQGWNIGSARLELRAAFPAGKLVVLDANNAVVSELKLAQQGSWPIEVAGQSFAVNRVRGFMGPKTEVQNAAGVLVPMSAARVKPHLAPPGSQCATHASAMATGACARCGTFFCAACVGADVLHCVKCAGAQLEQANRDAAATKWMVPGFVFVPIFGLLGGLLGVAAGAATMAVVKRTEKKGTRIAAAVFFYGIALAVSVALTAAVLQARE